MQTYSQQPKFGRNPVYAVDVQSVQSGKRVAGTKRRVRFRFGFSNAEALAEGLTGTACRGEEHEVILVWSLTSGKRLILADGQEVHFSTGPRTQTKFEASWTMRGNHTLQIIAHAAPPLFADKTRLFRQFDLTIDGLSFYDFSKIYELGISNKNDSAVVPRNHSAPVSYNNYSVPPEEAVWSRTAAVYEERHHLDQPASVASEPQEVASDILTGQTTDFYDAPADTHDAFAPVAPTVTPLQVHSEILKTYGAPAPQASPTGVAQFQQALVPVSSPPSAYSNYQQPAPPATHYQQPASPAYSNYQQQPACPAAPQQYAPQGYAPQVQYYAPEPPRYESSSTLEDYESVDTPAPASPTALEVKKPIASMYNPFDTSSSEAQVDGRTDVETAMSRLVNLENIEDVNFAAQAKERALLKQQQEFQKHGKKSKPMPPTAPSWTLGVQPSLGDMVAHKPAVQARAPVMATAFDANAASAGMLVMYNAHAAPPLQQAAGGFGVGAQLQNGGYVQRQAQPQQVFY